MSWLLTILGLIVLVILHELGHFVAAKAVGMRVERFALFIGPLLVKVRRGETEYGIAALPLGGYVKISGMNPREELAPEVAPRAFFRQPVWKRVVVVLAGPLVNVAIAFLILWPLYASVPVVTGPPTTSVAPEQLRPPASQHLRPGDRIVAVDGHGGSADVLRAQIASHRCAGAQVDGCLAATPARIVVERQGRRHTFLIKPRFDGRAQRPLLGFQFQPPPTVDLGPIEAAGFAAGRLWEITAKTVSTVVQIFVPERRAELGSIVGGSKVLYEGIEFGPTQALVILAIISLSLAIVNMFPFLPLDGGHIFWALAEKVRGRPIRFETMERSMAVGFVLVITLFLIGLTNDIGRLRSGEFEIP